MTNIGSAMAWANDRTEHETSAKEAINKCKRIEREKIKNGWRWFKIGNITKYLIPCDKNGVPTKQGNEMIEKIKNSLGI